MRAFLALEFSDQIKSAIGDLAERLRFSARGAKWVPSNQLHLTLKFFEDIPQEKIPEVDAAVTAACREARPFSVSLRGLGTFGQAGAARVIWAGISDGNGSLASLARLVEDRLEKMGVPKESRSFNPHVTLCRFREPCRAPALAGAIESLKGYECGTFQASELALFSSQLGPSGAVHTLLRTYPMGAM